MPSFSDISKANSMIFFHLSLMINKFNGLVNILKEIWSGPLIIVAIVIQG